MTKQFGTGNEPFLATNGDVAKGAPEELTRPTNQAFNTFYQTGKSIVEIAGNTLTPADGTNENPAQVGESVVKIAREQIGAYVTTTGAAGTYVATLTPVTASLVVGMCLCVVFNASTTAAATINVNGLGAKSIKTVDTATGTKATPAKISTAMPYFLVYDGVDFVVANDQLKGDADAGHSFATSAGLGVAAQLNTTMTKTFPYAGKLIVFSFFNSTAQNVSTAAIANRIYIDNVSVSEEQTFGASSASYTMNVSAGQTVSMKAQALNIGTTASVSLTIRLSYIYVGGL